MQIQSTYLNVSSQVVRTFALVLNNFSGSFNGSTDSFLQLHDAKAVPANGAVPLRVYDLPAGIPFSWAFPNGLRFTNGLVFAISTTEETLTVSTEKMELFVDAYTNTDNTTWSTIGDYTTNVPYLQVWADTAGPKTLKRVEVTPLTAAGATQYVQLFTRDDVSAGDSDFVLVIPYTTNTNADLFFDVSPQHRRSPVPTLSDGCWLYISSSGSTYNDSIAGTTALKASYV